MRQSLLGHLSVLLVVLTFGVSQLACDTDDGGNDSDTPSDQGDTGGDTPADTPTDSPSDVPTDVPGDVPVDQPGDVPGDLPPQDMAMDMQPDIPPGQSCVPEAFDVGATYATEIFVATDGSDMMGDGSSGSPYGSIDRALQGVGPGTRIVVRAGTYTIGPASSGSLQGTAQAPIKIEGEGTVVLDMTGQEQAFGLQEPQYLVIENLTIENTNGHGMNIDDGGDFDADAGPLVLRNLTLRNIGSGDNDDCIKLSGVDDFFVLDSDISGCDIGEGIDMVGCHDGVIAGNHFHDTPGTAVQAKGGSSGTLITGNRFTDVAARSINAGGSTGNFFRPMGAPHEAANLRISGNIIVRPGTAAVAFTGCDACIFAHNTVIEPQRWLARILQENNGPGLVPSRDGLFVNNIVQFNVGDLRNGVYVNVGGNTAPDTFTFDYNVWNAMDTPGFTGPSYSDGIPAEGNPTIGDPMLDGSYRTPAGSIAEGAGNPVAGSWPDYDGRCYGNPPSAGAFEVAP